MTLRVFSLLLAATTVVSCGDSPIDPGEAVNYGGTWRGTFGTSQPATVTWTVTQTGAAISGPAVVLINLGSGVQFTGTIAGAVVNGQLALTLTVPAGAIPGVPGCSISGTTTTTVATATTIEGDVVTTFSSACVGTVTDQAVSTGHLRLTKA